MSEKLWLWTSSIALVVLVFVATLTGLTIWATSQSKARTACYKAAGAAIACPQRSLVESWLAETIGETI